MIPIHTLVIVEWYTYDHIPRTRHVVVASLDEATQWQREGRRVSVHHIDPELYGEFEYIVLR